MSTPSEAKTDSKDVTGFNESTHGLKAPRGPRTLHIYRDSPLDAIDIYRVKDHDEQTLLYVAEVSSMTRPQIQIYSAAEYDEKGSRSPPITALLHHTSSDIEVTVRDQKFYLVRNGWLHKRHEWPSAAFGNNTMNWRMELSYGTKECYLNGDKKNVIARFVSAGWSPSKVGDLQILSSHVPKGPNSPALEELLVTMLADRERSD